MLARSGTKVSPTIVQLHRLRGSGLIVQQEFFREEATMTAIKKDAFSSRLVSHSKGSLRVYFFSSGSVCVLAGALDGWDPTAMDLALGRNISGTLVPIISPPDF